MVVSHGEAQVTAARSAALRHGAGTWTTSPAAGHHPPLTDRRLSAPTCMSTGHRLHLAQRDRNRHIPWPVIYAGDHVHSSQRKPSVEEFEDPPTEYARSRAALTPGVFFGECRPHGARKAILFTLEAAPFVVAVTSRIRIQLHEALGTVGDRVNSATILGSTGVAVVSQLRL